MTSSGRAQAAKASHGTAIRMIALATVAHMLRSRRFYERVITIAIGMAAAKRIGQENQASALARLSAWDKRQAQRLERKARQQGRAVRGSTQMVRSGMPRQLGTTKNET